MAYLFTAGAAILEKLLGDPSLEVTAFHVSHHNVTRVRKELKAMRDRYYVNFVSVLSADVTQHVMDQVRGLLIVRFVTRCFSHDVSSCADYLSERPLD